MSKVLPILFNTEMVRAILDGRKTVTRRCVKPQPKMRLCYVFAGYGHGKWEYPGNDAWEYWGEEFRRPDNIEDDELGRMWTPPCRTDDTLYVRETWERFECHCCEEDEHSGICTNTPDRNGGCYMYRASNEISGDARWHPSIHMPKEAVRIWLKVTDVRVERLQEITEEQVEEGGFVFTPPCLHQVSEESYCDLDGPCTSKIKYCDMSAGELYGKVLWDSTIKKSDIDRYGWDANPWVWVIKFERCEKPEGWCK